MNHLPGPLVFTGIISPSTVMLSRYKIRFGKPPPVLKPSMNVTKYCKVLPFQLAGCLLDQCKKYVGDGSHEYFRSLTEEIILNPSVCVSDGKNN